MESSNICKNCSTQFRGNYCPHCAQSVEANSRLNFKNTVADFIDTVFNLEKGFFYTFWNLLKQPGKVAKSFIDGKRKRFTNPIKYLILTIAIKAIFDYFLLTKDEGVPFTSFSFLSEEMNRKMQFWNQFMNLDYPLLFGVLNLLIWPIPFYFLFKKLKYNYTELITMFMYLSGTVVILIELLVIIYLPITGGIAPMPLVALLSLSYFFYAILQFYKKGTVKFRIIKIVVALLFVAVFRILILPLLLSILIPIT